MRGCETGDFLPSEYPFWRVRKLKDECPSLKTSWRAKCIWPALEDGMTLDAWNKAALDREKEGGRPRPEGVPSQYPCELRKKGYIALEPVESA